MIRPNVGPSSQYRRGRTNKGGTQTYNIFNSQFVLLYNNTFSAPFFTVHNENVYSVGMYVVLWIFSCAAKYLFLVDEGAENEGESGPHPVLFF